ncbi:MAG: hypothetical protein V7752_00575 [Halopseudomonas sp.]
MEWLVSTAALLAIAGVVPQFGRDSWKAVLWILLFGGQGFAALLSDGTQNGFALSAILAITLALASLAVLTLDAGWGRSKARFGLPGLLALGAAVVLLPSDQIDIVLWSQTALLTFAVVVFARLELQHRPGAGWILLGLLAWLGRLWLPSMVSDETAAGLLDAGLGLAMLLTFMLAVRKQLRLTPTGSQRGASLKQVDVAQIDMD